LISITRALCMPLNENIKSEPQTNQFDSYIYIIQYWELIN